MKKIFFISIMFVVTTQTLQAYEQSTSGNQSPIVTGTNGSVTIIYQKEKDNIPKAYRNKVPLKNNMILKEMGEILNISVAKVDILLGDMTRITRRTQRLIKKYSNSSISYSSKIKSIESDVSNYFNNSVKVKSAYRGRPVNKPIKEYLNALSKEAVKYNIKTSYDKHIKFISASVNSITIEFYQPVDRCNNNGKKCKHFLDKYRYNIYLEKLSSSYRPSIDEIILLESYKNANY